MARKTKKTKPAGKVSRSSKLPADVGPCVVVPGCTRRAAPGRGGGKDCCAMHYRRFKRTGSYGGADAELDNETPKVLIKIYGSPELKDELDRHTDRRGISLSEWGAAALTKELEAQKKSATATPAAA